MTPSVDNTELNAPNNSSLGNICTFTVNVFGTVWNLSLVQILFQLHAFPSLAPQVLVLIHYFDEQMIITACLLPLSPKALSTVASIASFDKNPQSKERGITKHECLTLVSDSNDSDCI